MYPTSPSPPPSPYPAVDTGGVVVPTGPRWGDAELAGTLQRLVWMRAAVVSLAAGLFTGAMVLFSQEPPWRLVVVLGMLALLALFTWQDLTHLRGGSLHFPLTHGRSLVLYAVLIAVTGGIGSPALPILIPTVAIFSIVHGQPAALAARVGAMVLFIGALALVEWWIHPDLLIPDLYRPRHDGLLPPLWILGMVVVMALAMAVGGYLTLQMRLALDRAVGATHLARQEMLESVRAQNRELMGLTASLAHELKNPLASIRGLSVLLARRLKEDSPDGQRMAVLSREAERMGEILDALLSFSRPFGHLEARPVKVEALLTHVGQLFEGQARMLGVQIHLPQGALPRLIGDERKLLQVMINLFQNALDAMPGGGRLDLRARAREGVLELELLDTGTGLAAEVKERLFTPGVTSRPTGTGIGLALSRAIAQQHGGSLTLEEREGGGGCCARLRLPLAGPGEITPPA